MILAAGGTIGMAGAGGAAPELDADALVAAVPGLDPGRLGAVRTVSTRPSAQTTGAEALEVARAAAGAAVADGVRGVVVTHGTDTLEEVAFLCDLLYGDEPPIVFTGAMRPASAAGADGPANLLDAVAVASAPSAAGLGVLVAFAGAVHAAREVRKGDSTAPAAFGSPGAGPVGSIREGRVEVNARPERRTPLAVASLDARVEVVTAGLGTDGALVDAALGAGAEGLVVVALGAGHLPPPFLAAVARAAAAVPVVATVRPERGAILRATYAFEGAEGDLRASGAVCAGALSPAAARIKLMACLGAGLHRGGITAAFAPDDR